eukprot:5177332-Amphidinium_carterae.1
MQLGPPGAGLAQPGETTPESYATCFPKGPQMRAENTRGWLRLRTLVSSQYMRTCNVACRDDDVNAAYVECLEGSDSEALSVKRISYSNWRSGTILPE